MRKLLFTLMAVLLSTLVAKADLPFRNHRYDGFKVNAVASHHTVFIGNSITNMHEWREAFGADNILNRGVSGGVTDEMLENFEAVISGKPKKIFFMMGTNDLGTTGMNTAARVAQRVRLMLKRCKQESPSTTVYVQSILPSAKRNLDLQRQTNDSLRKICKEMNVTYIDLWDDLISVSQNNTHSLDNLHLLASGYRIWCKKIAPYVADNAACTYPDAASNNYQGINDSHGMRLSYFAMSKVSANDILMIGDEMVHGGEWHELLGLPQVKNRGNGWGYPGPNLAVIKKSITPIFKGRSDNEAPAKVFLYAGTADVNDSKKTLETIEADYRAIVEEIRSLAPNAEIYLQSLLPNSNAKHNTDRVQPLNAKIKAMAESMDKVSYVDLYTPLALNGVTNTKYFTGNYLYSRGYAKVAQLLAAHIPAAKATTDEQAEERIARFDARTALAKAISSIELLNVGTALGQYAAANVTPLRAKLAEAYALLAADNTPNEQFAAKAQELTTLLAALKMNMPTASDEKSTTWYNLYTPLRENRYTTSNGAGKNMTGEPKRLSTKNMWKFVLRADGSYDIVNRADGSYMNPVANYNAAVTTVAAAPAKGWELSHANTSGLFIIRSGAVQLNQTGSPQQFALYNWSTGKDGLDRVDTGCQFAIVEAEDIADNTDPDMPFLTTTLTEDGKFATNTRWYTLQITASGLHVSDHGTATTITLGTSTTELKDADLWCFVGNAKTGYKFYNKAAGATKVLAAPASLSDGNTGGSSFPILRDEKSLNGFRPYWRFATSTNLGTDKPAYYIYVDGATSDKLNNRGGKLAFWTGGADAGSAFQVKFAKQTFSVDATTGTLSGGGGSYHKLWTSQATAPNLTLSTEGANNMVFKNGVISAWTGTAKKSTYTLRAEKGYTISDYSFSFKNDNHSTGLQLTAGKQSFTTSGQEQALAMNDLLDQPAQFVIAGENKGVLLSNFLVTVSRSLTPVEPQFNVFETRSTDRIPYRIPAIARAKNGNLIAVADYRHSGQDIGMVSGGRLDLHARISKDNGKTWGNKFSVIDGKGGDNGFWTAFGDPAIVADRESEQVLLLSCAGNVSFPGGSRENHQSIARFLSSNNGETWSTPTDLETQFYTALDNSSRGPVRAMFIGSGKIHQSRYTKVKDYYRLYLSTLVKDVNGTHCNYVYYSDDFGLTWKLLGDANTPAIPSGADEPKVEELPDGSIVCSSRVTGGRYYNIYSFTNALEGKGYWGSVAFSGESNKGTAALGNSTNGEIIVLPATRKSDGKAVYVALQSVPFGSSRSNVGIYYKELASFADYATPTAFAADWDGKHQASYMNSAYSTMCLQADNTLGFLYEESTYGKDYTIVYKNYSLEYITDTLYTFNAALNNAPILAEAAQTRVATTSQSAGDYVGMFDKAKVGELEALLEQFDATPSMEAYEKLNAFTAENTVALQMDSCYTFLNRLYPTLYLTPHTDSSTFTGVADQGEAQTFRVVKKGNDTFSLYNLSTKKWVGPTLSNYQLIKMVDEAQAGVFRLLPSLEGNSALECVNRGKDANPAPHLSKENKLVSWTTGSEASHWKLALVPAPTAIATALAPQTEAKAAIYDLQGRRVNKPSRGGIYIVGNKKVIF